MKENKICVKVYFNAKNFPEVVSDSEKSGIRRGGLQLFTIKPHGFADEKIANTDKISKFLKFCWKYWKASEAERLTKAAEIAAKRKELDEASKRLGVI